MKVHLPFIRYPDQTEYKTLRPLLTTFKGTLTPLVGIGACVSLSLAYYSPFKYPSLVLSHSNFGSYNLEYIESIGGLTISPQVSVQFGGFHYARRQFEQRNAAINPLNPTLSYSQYYLSGAFAGVANSVISGPIEHVRIRLQTQPHGAARLYSGPIDCVRKLSAHEGVLAGLYRGEAVTILREAQAYGVWFLAFEYMMNADAKRNGIKRDQISQVKVATYGGLAGEALWLSSYPFDVIKSKMQSDGFGPNRKYSSMRNCFAQTLRLEGARGFWKGIGPTLLRAMPVSAGTFAV